MILLYIAEGAFALNSAGIVLGAIQNKRAGLLLPAAAYGASSAVSFALSSWYPLFIGLGVARVLAAYEVGVDSRPAHRPSPIGMTVNYGIHILAGIVGSDTFEVSVRGLSLSTMFAAMIQGLDTTALFRTYSGLLADDPEARRQLRIKIAWLFPTKVIWYGLVKVFTAAIVRGVV